MQMTFEGVFLDFQRHSSLAGRLWSHILLAALLLSVFRFPFRFNNSSYFLASSVDSDSLIFSIPFRNLTTYNINVDPQGVAFDSYNNAYITDYYGQQIRKLDFSTGYISTVVGRIGQLFDSLPQTQTYSGFDDDVNYPTNRPTEVYIGNPRDIVIDSKGNIFMSCHDTHQLLVVTAVKKKLYVLAGILGVPFYDPNTNGHSGPSVYLMYPTSLALNKEETFLYFTESSNTIRKVNISDFISLNVSRVAGGPVGGLVGENISALGSTMGYSLGLALDSSGNIYYSDTTNHRIRKIGLDGLVNTVMGNGVAGTISSEGVLASSSSNNARVNKPTGLLLDEANSVIYYCDSGNFVLRKIRFTVAQFGGLGYTYTVVGSNGVYGNLGDGSLASMALLSNNLLAVSRDKQGSLYLMDQGNAAIRVVATAPTSSPSRQPSRQPSTQPSKQPFSHPTAQPSNYPSSHPTVVPTSQPTLTPTSPKSNIVLITVLSYMFIFFTSFFFLSQKPSDDSNSIDKNSLKNSTLIDKKQETNFLSNFNLKGGNLPIDSMFYVRLLIKIEEIFTPENMLSRIMNEVKTHHRWLELVSSMHIGENSRAEKYGVAISNGKKKIAKQTYVSTSVRILSLALHCLVMMVIISIIYSNEDFNPYVDGRCQKHITKESCLSERPLYGALETKQHQEHCRWQSDTNPQVCHPRVYYITVNMALLFSFVCAFMSQPIMLLFDWILYEVISAPSIDRFTFHSVDIPNANNLIPSTNFKSAAEEEKKLKFKTELDAVGSYCSKLIADLTLLRNSLIEENKGGQHQKLALIEFDKKWGLKFISNSNNGTNKHQLVMKNSTQAHVTRHIERVLRLCHEEEAILDNVSLLDRGHRLFYLFQRDLLPYWAGEVLKSRFDSENNSYNYYLKTKRSYKEKFAASVFLVIVFLTLILYLLNFFATLTKPQQWAWLYSLLSWLIADIVLISTYEVVLFKVLIPSIFDADFVRLQTVVLSHFTSRLKEFAKTRHLQTETKTEISIPSHLFLSHKTAQKYPNTLESIMIKSFKTQEVFNIECFTARPPSAAAIIGAVWDYLRVTAQSMLLNIQADWLHSTLRKSSSIFFAGMIPTYAFLNLRFVPMFLISIVSVFIMYTTYSSLSHISIELIEFDNVRRSALDIIKGMVNDDCNREKMKEISSTRRAATQGTRNESAIRMMNQAKDKKLMASKLGKLKKIVDESDDEDDDGNDDSDDDDVKKSVDDEDDDDEDDLEEGFDGERNMKSFMAKFKANNQGLKVPYQGKFDIVDTRYKQARLGQTDGDMNEYHRDQMLKFNLQNALNFGEFNQGSAFMVGYQTKRASNILKKAAGDRNKPGAFHNSMAATSSKALMLKSSLLNNRSYRSIVKSENKSSNVPIAGIKNGKFSMAVSKVQNANLAIKMIGHTSVNNNTRPMLNRAALLGPTQLSAYQKSSVVRERDSIYSLDSKYSNRNGVNVSSSVLFD